LRNGRIFFLVLVCLSTAFAGLLFAHQEPADGGANPPAANPAGERLVYKIYWDPPWFLFFLPNMEAGEVTVELSEDAEDNGRRADIITLKANSSGTLVRLAGLKVEDEFVFHTDAETFCTLSASEKVREGKRRRRVDVQYLRETHQLHIRELDEGFSPPKVKKDEFKNNIPACVHDPLSALYMFRRLPLREQFEHTFLLANDDRIREVRGTVAKQEIIETPSGKRAAWRISTAALMGGLFKEGGQFRIWLSADEKKLPVQFEVKVGLGRVLGKLKSAD
jgi:hypothetical protein